MDFLDSLDCNESVKKSQRMRSWYLYEQYKSLERNQLDAAQKLKNRTHQDKILRQELSERRARRKLYDRLGIHETESVSARSIKSNDTKTSLSVSTDENFKSFWDFQEHDCFDQEVVLSDYCGQSESQSETNYYDFQSIEPTQNSSDEEANENFRNPQSAETVTDIINMDIDNGTDNVEKINYHFDEVKEHLECLEKMTELKNESKNTDTESVYSYEETEYKVKLEKNDNNNVLAMWNKIVTFAYQIIQLNQGNCYNAFGSQFLTAVLACDVLRRGINTMCHILQPYVSPIKFSDLESISCRNRKSKKYSSKKKTCFKLHQNRNNKSSMHPRKYFSDDCCHLWQHCSRETINYRAKERKLRRASEPWRSVQNFPNTDNYTKSSRSHWKDYSSEVKMPLARNTRKHNTRHTKLNTKTMSKLSQYLDEIYKDIDLIK